MIKILTVLILGIRIVFLLALYNNSKTGDLNYVSGLRTNRVIYYIDIYNKDVNLCQFCNLIFGFFYVY